MLALTFVATWPENLQQAVGRVFAALQAWMTESNQQPPDGTINLKLIDDAEIADYNQQWAGRGEATDVLTFNYQEDTASGEPASSELADIVISRETAQRQATQAGTALEDEVALLALHGLLHVLGYDHATPGDQQRLDSLQVKLMGEAGLANREMQWKH